VVDAAIGSVIFAGLLWFAWLFGLGKAFGMNQDNIRHFEDAHFWINYGIFVMIGLSFFVRALRGVFRGD